MRMVHHRLTKNILGWKEGTHTLEVEYRGTKEELLEKLKREIEEDLDKHA